MTESELPRATHEGVINIGDFEISCSVLEDGTRLLGQSKFLEAIGRQGQPKGRSKTIDELPPFLEAKNLQPFISAELRESTKPVRYRSEKGRLGIGYHADIPVRLYYGPGKATSDIDADLLAWLIAIGLAIAIAQDVADDAVIREDVVLLNLDGVDAATAQTVAASLSAGPPPSANGWNGVCYFTERHDVILSTAVWINVGDIVQTTPEYKRSYLTIITRHELGHALCGLNDNSYDDEWACVAGLMSYCWMTLWFSDDELETVRWLYGGSSA